MRYLCALILTALIALVPPSSQAAPRASTWRARVAAAKGALLRASARAGDYGLRLGGRIIPHLTKDRSGQSLRIERANGRLADLELGKLIGKGFFGAVYHLAAPHALVPHAYAAQPLVVKTAHAPRWRPLRKLARWLARKRGGSDPPLAIAARRLELELRTYRFLQGRAARIAEAPSYPKDPAWRRGSLPVAPILATAQTHAGPVLIKPFIRGETPAQIIARHGKLTPEMRRSLHDIYDFVQACSEAIHVKKTLWFKPVEERARARGGKPLSLDARPHNLIWISDAKALRRLGLSRPSFILVELDQAMSNIPQYLRERTPFSDYVKEVERAR